MRKDSPLAAKEAVTPENLWDKPLIISRQDNNNGALALWSKREEENQPESIILFKFKFIHFIIQAHGNLLVVTGNPLYI